MLAKYNIEYAIPSHRNQASSDRSQHYLTDDPITCEEVLSELLQRGLAIKGIAHEGVALPLPEFDRMIKAAAALLTTRQLCQCLGLDSVEAHRRFGTPA